jgi:hypothetical protein
MIVDQDGGAIPFGAGMFEVADQFAFLAVDADDGETLLLEARSERADVLKLLIAVGAGVGGDLLAVDAQREIHLVKKASDGIGRDGNLLLLEEEGDLLGCFPGPLSPVMGSPAVSCSRSNSIAWIISGVFFPRTYVPHRFYERALVPRPRLITVVVRGPRCGDRGRGSRLAGDRRLGPV